MQKMLIAVALIAAAIQFLPAEFLIVLSLVPVAFAIGRPIARGVEALLAAR